MSRVYLLVLLELPPARQSPSNINLLKELTENLTNGSSTIQQPPHMLNALSNFVLAWQDKDNATVIDSIEQLSGFRSQTKDQFMLLNELRMKFNK